MNYNYSASIYTTGLSYTVLYKKENFFWSLDLEAADAVDQRKTFENIIFEGTTKTKCQTTCILSLNFVRVKYRFLLIEDFEIV